MTRKKRKAFFDKDFLDKIKGRIGEAKEVGSTFTEIAKKRAPEITKLVAEKGRESLDKGVATAKKAITSKKETLELIEKLGSMKSAGLLTEKEFQEKKKELLERF